MCNSLEKTTRQFFGISVQHILHRIKVLMLYFNTEFNLTVVVKSHTTSEVCLQVVCMPVQKSNINLARYITEPNQASKLIDIVDSLARR